MLQQCTVPTIPSWMIFNFAVSKEVCILYASLNLVGVRREFAKIDTIPGPSEGLKIGRGGEGSSNTVDIIWTLPSDSNRGDVSAKIWGWRRSSHWFRRPCSLKKTWLGVVTPNRDPFKNWQIWPETKGQLITKAIYGVLDSPKKQTKKIWLVIS